MVVSSEEKEGSLAVKDEDLEAASSPARDGRPGASRTPHQERVAAIPSGSVTGDHGPRELLPPLKKLVTLRPRLFLL